jgi:TRAP-type C4-dicarboxylate transport system permease small subunit
MRRFVNFLYDDLLVFVVKIVGIVMVLVLLAQVFSRLLMPVPLAWTEELSRYLFIWFCLLGCVLTLRQMQHLGIAYFYAKLPDGPRRALAIVIDVLVAVFGLFVLMKGLELIDVTSFQRSTVMRLPMKYVYLVLPIMGAMFVLHSAMHIWDVLAGKARY